MTPAATIPMHTPDEAIEELEYAVKELGLKVIVMSSVVRGRFRPISAAHRGRRARHMARRVRHRQSLRL